MATINTNNPSYADLVKRFDDDGKIDSIVELLAEDNPLINDAVVMEANGVTTHRTTVRTGLPAATWRMLNYGVTNGKSRTAQVNDGIGMLEAYAEVDKMFADLNGNTAAFRVSEDRAFLEAMSQEMEATVFYGNTNTAPAEFIGLAPRYSSLSADSGANIVTTGSSDDGGSTSVWFVTWGADTCHLIYPRGSMAGFQMRDLGEVTLEDAAGGKYQGYRTHYKWDLGLTLRDWRFVSRLANIDVSALVAGTYTDLIEDLTLTWWKLKNWRGGLRMYCNRTVATYLDLLAQKKTNMHLTYAEWDGRRQLTFRGVPIHITDALLETEGTVS